MSLPAAYLLLTCPPRVSLVSEAWDQVRQLACGARCTVAEGARSGMQSGYETWGRKTGLPSHLQQDSPQTASSRSLAKDNSLLTQGRRTRV